MPIASVALAVVAALIFAISTVLQQHAARSTSLHLATQRLATERPGTQRVRRAWLPVLGMLGRLMRNPGWLVGWLLNVLGFIAHAVALHLGSITVVQAILVVQLMLALMLTAMTRSLRPTRRDWFATAAVCVGVATLVLLRGEVPQIPAPRVSDATFLGLALGFIATILVVARRIGRFAQTRTALVAVGAGTSFCITAVFVVVVGDEIASGGPLGALGWPLLCLIGSAIMGSLLVQDSFASGSLPTALTAMTITDPLLSTIVGTVLFDVTPPAGVELAVGLPASGLLIAVGVVLLANSATLHDERHLAPLVPAQRHEGEAIAAHGREEVRPGLRQG
jgi:drug/metabolite transporter (DMT)-like permease